MESPFYHFMNRLIDYAGLFPPAQLPMEEAIRNYALYHKSAESWMLGRFICPASRLAELKEFKDTLFQEGEPFRFSVLSGNGQNQKDFGERLEKDLAAIAEFREFHGGRVIVDALEAKIPEDVLQAGEAALTAKFLNKTAAAIEKNGPPGLTPFYETTFPKYWKNTIKAQVKGINEHNAYISGASRFKHCQPAGFKLRCGGSEPHLYPTTEQVAFVIANCRSQRVPLKATAGLHHPLRHFNATEQVNMHGFFNVFGAGILADAHELGADEVIEIIEDENPKNFIFTNRAFAWKSLRTSLQDIQKARANKLLSFGSCSFDEPLEDLRRMKLL